MKLSLCDCGNLLQFEQQACRRCGTPLGFIPGTMELTTLDEAGEGVAPKARPEERWRRCVNAEAIARAWLPLTAAVNSLNRSMAQPDLYPFDPSPNVLSKVRFIHELLHPDATPAPAPRRTGASAPSRARRPAKSAKGKSR